LSVRPPGNGKGAPLLAVLVVALSAVVVTPIWWVLGGGEEVAVRRVKRQMTRHDVTVAEWFEHVYGGEFSRNEMRWHTNDAGGYGVYVFRRSEEHRDRCPEQDFAWSLVYQWRVGRHVYAASRSALDLTPQLEPPYWAASPDIEDCVVIAVSQAQADRLLARQRWPESEFSWCPIVQCELHDLPLPFRLVFPSIDG
jgi:hypothetical protein